jgi:hypothetical protein
MCATGGATGCSDYLESMSVVEVIMMMCLLPLVMIRKFQIANTSGFKKQKGKICKQKSYKLYSFEIFQLIFN